MAWLKKSGNIAFQIQNEIVQQENIWVRWFRKPRWIPMAKTKIYRIRPRPEKNEKEYDELKRLHNNYRTQMKTLRRYFHAENLQLKASKLNILSEQYRLEQEKQLERCFAINDEWNRKIAEERKTFEEQIKGKEENYMLQKLENMQLKEKQRIRKAEEKIQKAIKQSESFITLENLDLAIEKCLQNETDYNFAIDLQGNYHRGRYANSNKATKKPESEVK